MQSHGSNRFSADYRRWHHAKPNSRPAHWLDAVLIGINSFSSPDYFSSPVFFCLIVYRNVLAFIPDIPNTVSFVIVASLL